MKNLNLDENQSKNSNADQSDNQSERIIQFKRFDRKRRASKFAERMILYNLRKRISRINVIIRNKFAYKKILKCLIHMTRVLVTLIIKDNHQSDKSQTIRNVTQRFD